MNESCYERCVPKPGSSLSSGETTCFTNCMDKYMAAWKFVPPPPSHFSFPFKMF